ncbi:MAG: esterase/lipase family protein [Planctomycetaceae bacterium]
MERLPLTAVILGLALACRALAGDAPARESDWLAAVRRSREALEWSDRVVRHDWRLQQRPRDGRCRILDPLDAVVREGDDETCRLAFAALEADGTIPVVRGPTVILLHGLGEGRDSMRPLADHLRTVLEATVMLVGYASTSADLAAHGRSLGDVVAGMPSTARISFVGHSLGNLVVRRWMTLADDADLARIDRMVMLGPPNRGSDLARQIAGAGMLATLAEGAARDLVIHWPRVEPTLAVPACEFGIVAGGRGDGVGFSHLLDGDDDAIVRVDETRLDGADDFLLVPVDHAALLRDRRVKEATAAFLGSGRFPQRAGEAAR